MLRALRLLTASTCLKSARSAGQTCSSCLTGLPLALNLASQELPACWLCSGTGSLQPPRKVTAMEAWELGLDPVCQVLSQETLPVRPLTAPPHSPATHSYLLCGFLRCRVRASCVCRTTCGLALTPEHTPGGALSARNPGEGRLSLSPIHLSCQSSKISTGELVGGNAKAGMARAEAWGWTRHVVPDGVRSPCGRSGEFRSGKSQGKGGRPGPGEGGQAYLCI